MATIKFQIKFIIDTFNLKMWFCFIFMILDRKIRLKAEILSKIDTFKVRPTCPYRRSSYFRSSESQIGVQYTSVIMNSVITNFGYNKPPLSVSSDTLRGGYGTDFDFRNIRAPFAATRSFLNEIHQTKYCVVV